MRNKENLDEATLARIIHRCNRVESAFRRFGYEFAYFETDEDLRDVVSMNLQQIGEDSTHLSDELKERTADRIPWRLVKDMRNLFAHKYSDMSIHTIWETAINDVSPLKDVCLQELEKLQPNYDNPSGVDEPSYDDEWGDR